MEATCPQMPPPVVNATFTNNKPVYNLTLSSAELGSFKIDTQVSHSPHETFHVGGLTVSAYGPTYNIEFQISTNPNNGRSCLYIDHVDLDLTLSPTVYIANAFAPGSCRYTDTMRHEQRHVDTSVITLNEYFPVLRQIAEQTARADAVTGPIPTSGLGAAEKKVADDMRDALTPELGLIDKIHFERQQQIDTRAEYMRATRACPNEPLP